VIKVPKGRPKVLVKHTPEVEGRSSLFQKEDDRGKIVVLLRASGRLFLLPRSHQWILFYIVFKADVVWEIGYCIYSSWSRTKRVIHAASQSGHEIQQ